MKATHCFRRETFMDKDNYTEARTFHQYTLIGIGRIDRDGIDIYRYFFNSAFKKGTQKRVSVFFVGFVRLFILKCLMERTPDLSFRKEIESIVKGQLFRVNKQAEEKNLLMGEAKMVAKALQQKYRSYFGNEKPFQQEILSSFVQYALKITDIIHRQMSEFMNQLKNNAAKIMQEEYVPQKMSANDAIRVIATLFDSINRMHIMRHTRKISLLKDLNASFNQKHCVINMRYLSNEQQPIMIVLSDMAVHREVQWKSKEYREVWKKLVHSIVTCCKDFHEHFQSYLPALTAQDVCFDQKKLKAVLTYDKMILDGIGLLDPDTRNIECSLALAPTPTFNQESCYSQQQPHNKWLLKRKYYVRRVQGAEQDDQLVHLMQNIHVWRIINLVFYLRQGKHLSQYFYQQYYPARKFNIHHFRQARRRIYDEIKEGTVSVAKIFNIQQHAHLRHKNMNTFGFTLSEVKNLVGEHEQDSLIQRLPVKRVQDYLMERSLLFKQICDLLLHEIFFKQLPNAKKYIIIILLSYFEEADYLQTIRKVSSDTNKLNSTLEKRRDWICRINNKIREYHRSPQEKINNKYVRSKYETLIKNILAFEELWNKTLQKDELVRTFKQKLVEMKEDMGNSVEQRINMENSIENLEISLKDSVQKMMNKSHSVLFDYMEEEINPDLSRRIQTVHKKDDKEFWNDYGMYLIKKLKIMVKALLWLKYDNWLKYNCLFSNTLVQDGSVSVRYETIMHKQQVVNLERKLLEVQKMLDYQIKNTPK